MVIFKYFTDIGHARAFLDGNLLMRPLSAFRQTEDEGVRGDRRDGMLTFAPGGWPPIDHAGWNKPSIWWQL